MCGSASSRKVGGVKNYPESAPEAVREFMAEIGRKGGSRKTEAQTQALARGRVAGNAVESAQAIGRRAQIQALKEAGYKQREVAEKWALLFEQFSVRGSKPKGDIPGA